MTEQDPSGGPAFRVLLPYDDTATGSARRLVTDLWRRCADPSAEKLGDAGLVAHELVLNGLTHGAPDDDGRLELSSRVDGGDLEISVLDHGTAGTVAAQPFSAERASGRGLVLVSALSRRWSVDRSSGTRVSAWLTA